jgi:hypothetical protein
MVDITLFISIKVLCGSDNIIWNIPHIHNEYGIILQNIVSFIEHCYGFE